MIGTASATLLLRMRAVQKQRIERLPTKFPPRKRRCIVTIALRTLIVFAALAALSETASAAGGIQFFYSTGSPGYRSRYYNSYSPGLRQRTIARHGYRYPTVRYRQGTVRYSVNPYGSYDYLRRRSAYYGPYRSGVYYNPYRSRLGIGYSTPGFSIRLGR